MEQTFINLLLIVLSYLVGSISTGYILVRYFRGIDIRTKGSGNIGARNVGRLMGKHGFVITLVGDTLKGVVVVLFARWLELVDTILFGMIIGVVAGHIWPVFLQFKGGKGIATALGVFAVYSYPSLLVVLGITGAIWMMTQNITKSWISAMMILPVFMVYQEYRMHEVVMVLIVGALLVYGHRENIRTDILSSIKES